MPVLAALGVTETGQKCLLSLRLAASEAATTWGAVVTDLQQRGLVAPLLLVVDGNGGLKSALKQWDGVRVQRCTTHKLDNLKDHCPRHARREMKRDYDRIIYATDALAARAAYDAFLKKWSTLCPAVATSLAEAGLELLTFYDFPKATWKSIRTTNILENLNREFRVDPLRLEAHVRVLSEKLIPRDWKHPEHLDEAAAYIRQEFEGAGGRVREQSYQMDGRTYRNVVADLGPETRDVVIVGAHYDAFGSFPPCRLGTAHRVPIFVRRLLRYVLQPAG